MKSGKKKALKIKIQLLAVLPAAVIFIVSMVATVFTMSNTLRDLTFDKLHDAGRGMEMALTQLDAEFTRDEVNDIFDMLAEDTGNHYTLYMGQDVYATSVKENGQRLLDAPLDESMFNTIMAGNEVKGNYWVINGEAYNFVIYPASQKGEVFGAMMIAVEHSTVLNLISDAPKPIFYSSLVVLIIAVISGILVTKSIEKSLNATNSSMEQLAKGNLAQMEGIDEFSSKKDELGEMTSNIVNLQNELSGIVTDIKSNSEELLAEESEIHEIVGVCNNASAEISRAIEDIANGSISQAEKLTQANTEMSEVENAINEISDNINQSTELVKLMMDSSNKTRDIFEEFVQANRQTAESIDMITNQITNSADASQQIVAAVDMINDIASQTNLLSLNASIEAARAGESGKGFAVVAGEIKALSDQSAQSAQGIRAVIEKLAIENNKNVEMANGLKTTLEKQTGIMEQSVAELKQLLEYIAQTKDGLDVIDENSNEINRVIGTIVDTLASLSTIAESNAAASEETTASMQELNANVSMLNTSSERLNSMAMNLNDRMDFFKL